jgi:hypothetical protein
MGRRLEAGELLIVEIEMSLFDLIEGEPVRLTVRLYLYEDVSVLESPEGARVAASFRAGLELHLHAETHEPEEVVLSLQRTFDAGARDLELPRAGKRVFDVDAVFLLLCQE